MSCVHSISVLLFDGDNGVHDDVCRGVRGQKLSLGHKLSRCVQSFIIRSHHAADCAAMELVVPDQRSLFGVSQPQQVLNCC